MIKALDWSKLKKVPKNKLVSTSYIWIVIVPIVAKVFSKIESIVYLKIGDVRYELILELPFSWQMFFWSALLFTVGNVLFSWLCPFIVKNYDNFDHFQLNGGTESIIRNNLSAKSLNAGLIINNKRNEGIEKYFWAAYESEKTEYEKYRSIISMFYLTGFSLFLCVSMSNIVWVIRNGYAF